MKNSKKIKYVDVLADIEKSPNFERFSEDADVKIRFALEVYNLRKESGWSQSELAKKVYSTQKVISRIESGSTNVGIELINRISKKLGFNSENLTRTFNRPHAIFTFDLSVRNSQVSNEIVKVSDSINFLGYKTN